MTQNNIQIEPMKRFNWLIKPKSLYSAITFPFLFQIFLFALILITIYLFSIQHNVESLLIKQQQQQAYYIDNHLNVTLNLPKQLKQQFKMILSLQPFDQTTIPSYETIFTQLLQTNPSLAGLAWSASNQDLIALYRHPTKQHHFIFLQYQQATQQFIIEQLDIHHKTRQPLIPPSDFYLENLDHITTPNNASSVTTIHYLPLIKQRVLANSQPLTDQQGQLIGTMSYFFDLQHFNQQLKQLAHNHIIFITDKHGQFIASSMTSQASLLDTTQALPTTTVANPLIAHSLHFLQQQTPRYGHWQTMLDQHFYHITRYPLTFNQAEEWQLVILTSAKTLPQAIYENIFITFLSTMLALIIASIISIFTTRWIIKPIQALNIATKKIVIGHSYIALPTERQDEIGMLAHNFERMHNQLQTYFYQASKREYYLSGLLALNQYLLQLNHSEINFYFLVEKLGKIMPASRVCIFLNDPIETNTIPKARCVACWQIEHETLVSPLKIINYQTIPYWYQTLSQNQFIHCKTRSLPATEYTWLSNEQVQRLLVLPLIADQAFYGFLRLDQCDPEGERWETNEVTLLSVTATSLALTLRQQKALQALQAKDHLLHTVYDLTNTGLCVFTQTGLIIELNRAFADIFNTHNEYILQKNINDIFILTETAQDPFPTTFTQFTTPIKKEWQVINNLGNILDLLVHIETLATTNNQTITVCSITDLTAYKRTLKALSQSEQRFKLAVKGTTEGIWDWDLLTDKVYYSPRLQDMLGTTQQHSWPPHLMALTSRIHPNDFEPSLLHLHDYLAQRTPTLEMRLRLHHQQGYYIWVLTRGSALWDEDSKPQRLVGTCYDMTEQIAFEQHLKETKEAAELANRAKTEFVANMSHELRTPLNAVLNFAEGLQEQIYGELNEKQLKFLRLIEESGRHLLSLINDILDLSKIEAGKMELEVSRFPVEALCQSCLRMIRQLAQKKQIKIHYTALETELLIQADERRLKQILVNLLSNAVKFTPERGNIGLTITADTENNTLYFTVWDTGIGIAKSDLNRIFEDFVQLNSGFNRMQAGTGLGLSLVYRMVQLHNGSIRVESRLAQGTQFIIALPWMQQAATVPDLANGEKPLTLPVTNNHYRILIAEDNEMVLENTALYLKHKGFTIEKAMNGAIAIQKAEQNPPDLILMDIQMPILNGLETIRLIRQNPQLATIPIIAVTALAMQGDRAACLASGANDYLSKPVHLQTLYTRIQSYLLA